MSGHERPVFKIPTRNPQPALSADGGGPRARPAAARNCREVVVTGEGVVVYPARWAGDRWRAVWYEPDGSRGQCQAVSEERLAAKLEVVAERLVADAPNMSRSGDELIGFYLSADRLPAERPWSRKHADTQRSLCARFLAPVIGGLCCQDIKVADMQAVVNAAPTAGEGRRVRAMISALTGAGITGGYLANPRLKDVHWQAKGRLVAVPRPAVGGESALFVDPGEIPSAGDVVVLGSSAGALRELYELMVNFAAYSGLRWGELAALAAAQIDAGLRLAGVGRKVIEVRGHLYVEAPKGRKRRRTVYPYRTPGGYPLAARVAERVVEVAAEQAAGRNPEGIMFPSPRGLCWRSSNFSRRVLKGAYLATGWQDTAGHAKWTWHSLRHVFCTTALNTWGLDVADVSRLAGHSTTRVTFDMYVGSVAGALERARAATG